MASIARKSSSGVSDERIVTEQRRVSDLLGIDLSTEEDIESLLRQCKSFDLQRCLNLYTRSICMHGILPSLYSKISEYKEDYIYSDALDPEVKELYATVGYKLIAAGKVALVLLSGGQSTHLNAAVPKGDSDFGFPSHKTLFERIFFSIRKIQNTVEHLYNIQVKIPIYIMTSEFNRNSIYSLLQSHNFYHLSESQFVLFTQGSLPCVDQHGVFILREKNQIALSPDGSGGFFFAMRREHLLSQWKEKGIQYIHLFGVDNAMELPADPFFLGYCHERGSEVCMKCVEKSCPEERLSVLVQYNKRPFMAIDSEMGYRKICERNSAGDMVYRIGFVFDTVMTVSFLSEKCVESALPDYCHIVKKAIPYYEPILGRTIKPVTPNAYKMQFYLTDVLALAEKLNVIMIPREEYAPIRNPPGSHVACPETAVRSIEATHLMYLQHNQALIEGEPRVVEISPLVSVRGEGLQRLKGVDIHLPCLIYDQSEVNQPYEVIAEGVGKLLQPVEGYVVYLFL